VDVEGADAVSRSQSHRLEGSGVPTLHVELWRGRSPRGTLVLAPGLGDHCGRYAHMAERLAGEPGLVDVVGFDYRGHGRSEGRRGVVRHYGELVDDLERVVAWARARAPGRPLFVLGHSNGGLVALTARIDGRLAADGLVVTSPALRLKAHVPGWKLGLGRLLGRVAPWVTLGGRLPGEHLSRDPEMLAARRADPLVHARLSPPLFFGMREAGARVMAEALEVSVPLLMIVGRQDPVIDPESMLDFFDRIPKDEKRLHVDEEGVHEPLHDRRWPENVEVVAAWLRGRLDAGSRRVSTVAGRERLAE
jgi:alpha-beta hydrolase superfamily lysophospholipase